VTMSAILNMAAQTSADPRSGETLVLPGQTPEGGHILALLLKRTYDIHPGARCVRAESDQALIPGDVHWGNPLNSTVRFESDFVPFKLATDVVFDARVYAPGGLPTPACTAAVKLAGARKDVRVIGNRTVRYQRNGPPLFTDPEHFTTMELRYELAYGGIDVYADPSITYPYPRNPLGRGFAVVDREQGIEGLALPNLEDPADLLIPERLCIQDYASWERQPIPAALGWFPKTAQPRCQYAGIMPADRTTEQELRQAYAKLVPAEHRDAYLMHGLRDMDFRYFNGASPGLALPYLAGDEEVATANLCPAGVLAFHLPGERPRLGLDIGRGLEEPEPLIQTLMVRMEDRQIDLVWRGAVSYPGLDWLPTMRKMEILIR
jgi:hypothetical protein